MQEILTLKPNYIFDVVNSDVFIEKDDSRHRDYMHCKNYYEIYYAVAKYYQPKSILEIGVRYGYSLYSMIAACENLGYVRGYDIDDYNNGSVEIANKNISKVISEKINFKVENKNTQNLKSIRKKYDLIHVDGDHTYAGKLHDLNLVKNNCKVLIIDDYNHIREVKSAVDKFISENEDTIEKNFIINSMRGTYVVEFKSN